MDAPLLDLTSDGKTEEPDDGSANGHQAVKIINVQMGSKLADPEGEDADDDDDESDGPNPLNKAALFSLLLTLFIQWLLMSIISSFFPDSFVGREISDTVQGVIFASFPVGAMVTSPFIAKVMRRLKPKRTIILGVCCMIVFPLCFGLVPFVISTPSTAAYAFAALGFIYGAGSTLAEMGAYAMLTQIGSERGNVGQIISIAEVVTGVGCMVGPPIGGELFQLGSVFPEKVQFFFPFAVACGLPAILLFCIIFLLPKRPNEPDDSPAGSLCGDSNVLRVSIVCLGITITAATYAAFSPTLEIRLDHLGVPAATLSGTTGLFLFMGSALYMVGALPVGRFLDKGCCTRLVDLHGQPLDPSKIKKKKGDEDCVLCLPAEPRKLRKLPDFEEAEEDEPTHYLKKNCLAVPPSSTVAPMVFMGIGAILNVYTTVTVGPFRLGSYVNLDVFNTTGWVLVALIVQGLASCFIVIPSMPALLLDISRDDERGQARVTGVWGACYAAGTSIGPFLGDTLMQMEVPFLCREYDWPTQNASDVTTQAMFVSNTSTVFPPLPDTRQHCFDGAFTLLALINIAYATAFWVFFVCEFSRYKKFR